MRYVSVITKAKLRLCVEPNLDFRPHARARRDPDDGLAKLKHFVFAPKSIYRGFQKWETRWCNPNFDVRPPVRAQRHPDEGVEDIKFHQFVPFFRT